MKVYLRTFGCRVNQYETQIIREQLLADPLSDAVPEWQDADLCLINTCTVTKEADNDAVRLVRRIAKRNPSARLIVTGCLATRDPQAILKEAPDAILVGNKEKKDIPAMLGCKAAPAVVTGLHGRARAFVKIQDGCNMHCTFCVIPEIRPTLSSKPFGELEAEVRGLILNGRKEIVLCGVRLGRYMSESDGKRVDFVGMLARLIDLPGDFRIRLSSLEITDLTERLIGLMVSSEGRIAPSLHLPLQSGSDAVLRRMKRWYSTEFFERRVVSLRERLPQTALFTDIMVGFPGETRAEHDESRRFAEKIGFSGLHVFRYSARPGTEAAQEDLLPEDVVRERAEELRSLSDEFGSDFAKRSVGSLRRVVMNEEGGRPEGLTEDFLRVRLSGHPGPGFHRIRIEAAKDGLGLGILA